jgi:hypothetical protein
MLRILDAEDFMRSVLVLTMASIAAAQNWPSFRGTEASGVAATFKKGLYGAGTASDVSAQKWKLLCLDRKTGKMLWERVAFEGVPKEKRHIKSTYANATPATDGQVVIAFFGSQGAYGFDLDGKLLWSRDLGRFDAGRLRRRGVRVGHGKFAHSL